MSGHTSCSEYQTKKLWVYVGPTHTTPTRFPSATGESWRHGCQPIGHLSFQTTTQCYPGEFAGLTSSFLYVMMYLVCCTQDACVCMCHPSRFLDTAYLHVLHYVRACFPDGLTMQPQHSTSYLFMFLISSFVLRCRECEFKTACTYAFLENITRTRFTQAFDTPRRMDELKLSIPACRVCRGICRSFWERCTSVSVEPSEFLPSGSELYHKHRQRPDLNLSFCFRRLCVFWVEMKITLPRSPQSWCESG